MAPFDFIQFMQDPRYVPWWLRQRVGSAFLGSVGASLNGAAAKAEAVASTKSPLLCDASALSRHGKDRRIRRYSTESEASYRLRLAKWQQIWQTAGSAYGKLRQLRIFLSPFGRPLMRIVHQAGDGSSATWYTLEPGQASNDFDYFGMVTSDDPDFSYYRAEPSNWDWDGQDDRWSRYWVLIYTDGLTNTVPTSEWDSTAEWDSGTDYWDGYFTDAQVADLALLCRDWTAAHAMLAGLFLVHDLSAFNPMASPSFLPSGKTSHPQGNYNLHGNRREGVTYSIVRTVTS